MLRVNRFAAAIDMIAAGTRAPTAIAANAIPANQAGNSWSNSRGIASCGFASPSRPFTLTFALIAMNPSSASRPSSSEYAGRIAAFRRTMLRFLVDSTAVTECGYMNSASRRTERQGPVRGVARGARDECADRLSGGRVGGFHLRFRGVEDGVPAAELARQVEDRRADHQVDQTVLDERDHRRRPQPGRVRVRRQDGERDQQRQVLGQQVVAAETHRLEDGLHTDQLQRDVRHRRQDAGDRDRQRETAAAVPAADEVRRGHVAVAVGHRPEPGHEDEDDRVDHDRVRHREEAADRTGGVHRGRYGDEGVRRVEVATQQEPGDEGAEAPAAQTPFVQAVQFAGTAPAGRHEAHHRDGDEDHDDDDQLNPVDVVHRRLSFTLEPPSRPDEARRLRSSRITSWYEMLTVIAERKTQASWYQ